MSHSITEENESEIPSSWCHRKPILETKITSTFSDLFSQCSVLINTISYMTAEMKKIETSFALSFEL